MQNPTLVVPVITFVLCCMIIVRVVQYFVAVRDLKCSGVCPRDVKHLCREGDKSIVACIGAIAVIFITAQSLEWVSQGFLAVHPAYMVVWHGYDFFTAVTCLLFIHHLRARTGWRKSH